MPTNFELERLKPKFDIFKIPENRVHELTDSNVSRRPRLSARSPCTPKRVRTFSAIVRARIIAETLWPRSSARDCHVRDMTETREEDARRAARARCLLHDSESCPDARERAGPVFPPGGGGNTGPARSRARVGTTLQVHCLLDFANPKAPLRYISIY